MEKKTHARENMGCGAAGDKISAGQQLVVAGARLHDFGMIKAGMAIWHAAKIPFNVIKGVSRLLIQSDRNGTLEKDNEKEFL